MANDAASWVSNDQSGLDEIKVRVRSVLVDGAGGEDEGEGGLPSAEAGEGDTTHNAAGSMDGDGLVGAGDTASSAEQVEASLQAEAERATTWGDDVSKLKLRIHELQRPDGMNCSPNGQLSGVAASELYDARSELKVLIAQRYEALANDSDVRAAMDHAPSPRFSSTGSLLDYDPSDPPRGTETPEECQGTHSWEEPEFEEPVELWADDFFTVIDDLKTQLQRLQLDILNDSLSADDPFSEARLELKGVQTQMRQQMARRYSELARDPLTSHVERCAPSSVVTELPPDEDDEGDEEAYEVEEVLDKRGGKPTRDLVEYFVRWKGLSPNANCWVFKKNMNAKAKIKAFEDKLKSAAEAEAAIEFDSNLSTYELERRERIERNKAFEARIFEAAAGTSTISTLFALWGVSVEPGACVQEVESKRRHRSWFRNGTMVVANHLCHHQPPSAHPCHQRMILQTLNLSQPGATQGKTSHSVNQRS
jgi:hypothetical protein